MSLFFLQISAHFDGSARIIFNLNYAKDAFVQHRKMLQSYNVNLRANVSFLNNLVRIWRLLYGGMPFNKFRNI